ncbi:hypothetical protein C1N76_13775 [Geobacillus thermoleovorans]|uniref:Uncharacterized protein n=1 Tax=Geobacillus thermoleovorans TaxID=33941 RepID=A0A2Z3NCM7_GEOTH|nr:hypothetical protein C1N76_13775 [Geobacillus thermoleovorans]
MYLSKNLYMFHFNGCFTKYLCPIGKIFAVFFEKFLGCKKASCLAVSSPFFDGHIDRFLLLAASTQYGRRIPMSDR